MHLILLALLFISGFLEAKSPYFLVLLVDARHLDYSDNCALLRTLVKHPSDGSKNADVGHAWVYLHGEIDGNPFHIEGGHSGECGLSQPKYFEGLMHYALQGDPNPIRYLWACQKDGFFQEGSGGHLPTFAARVELNQDQFESIRRFINNYCYSDYYLTHHQCTSFVEEIALLAGLTLDTQVHIAIEPALKIDDKPFVLWQDPIYSEFAFPSPDRLELSLMQAVKEGRAELALEWYRKTHPPGKRQFVNLRLLPERLWRVWFFYQIRR